MTRFYIALIGSSFLLALAFAHPLDEVFSKGQKGSNKTTSNVETSVYVDMEKGSKDLKAKVESGDARAAALRGAATQVEREDEKAGSNSRSNATQSKSQPKSQAKIFNCKFYCKSASGPTTYKDFTANSRREAAQMAGDTADQVCNSKGLGYASSVSFAESQCIAR